MFQNTGVLIDHGAIHVVVILPLLIFGASVFVGGTLSTKLPAPNTSLVNILPLSQRPRSWDRPLGLHEPPEK
jgi:hypothetical protein